MVYEFCSIEVKVGMDLINNVFHSKKHLILKIGGGFSHGKNSRMCSKF